jgi:histidyl-tRNA synthetase
MRDSGAPPSGTRDFFGPELRGRQAAIRRVAEVFESFGFDPLETPAFERLEVLTGKYGEDEKLIFKIAKRGAQSGTGESDLALRYDLTVPLARFVAGHADLLTGTLRRYHIAPVWRADRPAKGRFREFYQCDVDILGSTSPLADAEVILAVATALDELGLTEFAIHLNSRPLLAALMAVYGVPADLERPFLGSIDKLYKSGISAVAEELAERGVPESAITQIADDQSSPDPAEAVAKRLSADPAGAEALEEMRAVESLVRTHLPSGRIVFDPYIARGLDYYTGCVFEIFYEGSDELQLSVASGGRYDGLIGMFADSDVPACGGSLGFERILLLLDAQQRASEGVTQVAVTCWDESFAANTLAITSALRQGGLRAEPYLGTAGLKAQLRFAARRGARVCVIVGPNDLEAGTVTVRNLDSGAQETGPQDDVVQLVSQQLVN